MLMRITWYNIQVPRHKTQGDESEDVENEESINTILARIADALVSGDEDSYV